jgi:hypothetical protein
LEEREGKRKGNKSKNIVKKKKSKREEGYLNTSFINNQKGLNEGSAENDHKVDKIGEARAQQTVREISSGIHLQERSRRESNFLLILI